MHFFNFRAEYIPLRSIESPNFNIAMYFEKLTNDLHHLVFVLLILILGPRFSDVFHCAFP
jgi:ABC-type microcin C transport system permease subunit YejB